MLTINITLAGDYACGKTRATEAIKEALKDKLPDKPYRVSWSHAVNGEITEHGSFTSEE